MATTYTESERLEICQAGFALNNLGVTLLQNGYFRDACKTFKAAVSAVKPLVRYHQEAIGPSPVSTFTGTCFTSTSSSTSSSVTSSTSSLTLLQRLQGEVTKASALATQKPSATLPMCIEISPLEVGDEDAWYAAQRYGPTASIIFPVRFRDFPCEATLQSEGLSFALSIITYNYGVARLLLHRYTHRRRSPRSQHVTLLEEAQRLLSFAEKLVYQNLQSLSSDIDDDDNNDDDNDKPVSSLSSSSGTSVCSLACLILGQLSFTYRLQRRNDKVIVIDESLARLQHVQMQLLSNHEVSLRVAMTPKNKLAAAAA